MELKDGTFEIIGCAMHVHNAMGPGLREKPYENAMVIALRNKEIQAEPQRAFPIMYCGCFVGECIPDITVGQRVLVDVKSIEAIGDNELAQMLNYLRISGLKVGLIINFKNAKLEWQRVVRSRE